MVSDLYNILQVLVGTRPHRRFFDVSIGLGHNNDQGILKLTELDEYLEKNNISVLGDGGYHHDHIIAPHNVPMELENLQKGERSDVETCIGFAKGWGAAADVFRQSPELHKYALHVVYELAQIRLTEIDEYEE